MPEPLEGVFGVVRAGGREDGFDLVGFAGEVAFAFVFDLHVSE